MQNGGDPPAATLSPRRTPSAPPTSRKVGIDADRGNAEGALDRTLLQLPAGEAPAPAGDAGRVVQ